MGIIKAFSGALGGTFADQWKDIITAGTFDEHTVVAPGVLRNTNNGRGANTRGSEGVISNGSHIFVPENTIAFIFSQGRIEDMIMEPGGYEYQNGEDSIFNGDGLGSLVGQVKDRFSYGGISSSQKQIAFINLREIRNIKFGTRGPQVYNDMYYGVDLEIFAYGSFSVRVNDPVRFLQNFVPPNVNYYSFDDDRARVQLLSEFIQSFAVALNSLSTTYRISQLPSQANAISAAISNDQQNAGTWPERFGLEIVSVAVENIEFSDESRELVRQYSSKKMDMKAYDDVSQRTSDIAAQQKIAQGIQDNGFGSGPAGMIMGMNIAEKVGMNANLNSTTQMSLDEQIEALKKLKELVDMGILSDEEFDVWMVKINGKYYIAYID